MKAYIKSFVNFKTYAYPEIADHDYVLASIYDEQSMFTIDWDGIINSGDFLICGRFMGQILTVDPGEGITKIIVCESILFFFKRDLIYPGDGATVEAFIASELTDNFKSVADTKYAMPYLTITHTAATSFIKPDIKDGIYNLKSYIAKVRRVKNVFVDFSRTKDNLLISVVPRVPDSHNIVMEDGHHSLVSQTLASNSVAKITTFQDSTATDWYLNPDGSITSTEPEIRVDGEWKTLFLDTDKVAADEVTNEFASNSHSHKIEFRSDKIYGFYDNVTLRIKGKALYSYISCIRKDRGDNRYLYKTGELRTTLTDKLKELT